MLPLPSKSLESTQHYVQVWLCISSILMIFQELPISFFFRFCNINQPATKAISEHVPRNYLNIFIPSILQCMDAYGLSAKCQCVNKANHPAGEQRRGGPLSAIKGTSR